MRQAESADQIIELVLLPEEVFRDLRICLALQRLDNRHDIATRTERLQTSARENSNRRIVREMPRLREILTNFFPNHTPHLISRGQIPHHVQIESIQSLRSIQHHQSCLCARLQQYRALCIYERSTSQWYKQKNQGQMSSAHMPSDQNQLVLCLQRRSFLQPVQVSTVSTQSSYRRRRRQSCQRHARNRP